MHHSLSTSILIFMLTRIGKMVPHIPESALEGRTFRHQQVLLKTELPESYTAQAPTLNVRPLLYVG